MKVAWGNKVSREFVDKVIKICEDFRWSDDHVSWLMACMAFESGETFSPRIYNAAGSGACVDTETEILTKYGWRRYNEINIGDRVYSINFEKNAMELDVVLNKVVKESDNNYRMTSRSFDSLTTYDHRWYMLQRYYARTDNTPLIQERTTEDIVNLKSSHTYNFIHPSIDYVDTITDLGKPLGIYKLVSAIAGNGSINKKLGKIELVADTVYRTEALEFLKNAIDEVFPEGVSFDFSKSGPGLIRWNFNKKQSEKLIWYFDQDYNSKLEQNRFVKKLNPAVFDEMDYSIAKALLDGYLMTDGHFCKSNNTVSFRNTERAILDDFQHVAILAGENPREVATLRGGTERLFQRGIVSIVKDIYTIYLRDSKFTSASKHQLKIIKSDEAITVWCPTTANHNWIARRNGTVYITGNCGLIQFMPPTAKGLGTSNKELSLMSGIEQLDYVKAYFKPYYNKIRDLPSMYMAILMPKYIDKPLSNVLFLQGTVAFRQNSGLDANHDGKITKAEAASLVTAKYLKGLRDGYVLDV